MLCIVFKTVAVNEKTQPTGKTRDMDELDRRILTELQDNFPVQVDPYATMAERLDITLEQLWDRIVAMVESGVIRRLGFSIDSRKIGYTSTLAAVKVPPEQV